ncbi:MAG: cell division protein ZapA, partial [Deltaproteobacteria bacterium]
MPELKIHIGGREFEVSCRDGEEPYLQSAAAMLDHEASALAGQAGRLPESRLLLMSGLLLADKTAGLEDQVKELRRKTTELEVQLQQAQNRAAAPPECIEVAVIPANV